MSSKTIKITDLISRGKRITYSFEVTPNISLDDIEKLTVEPAFFSITWHAKAHECKDLDTAPLRLANYLSGKGKNVLLHLACDLLKKEYLESLLAMLQDKSICNLFVILGENYDPSTSDFKTSKELIEHIKKRTGEYFCLGVAGSPDHSDDKLLYLKEKIDSGADFIITQAFFEPAIYKTYVNRCETVGIKVPIIPGIFLYESHKELIFFTNLCKVKVSGDLLKQVVSNKETERFNLEIVQKMLREINHTGLGSNHYHFFTLNKLELVSNFVEQL